MSITTPSSPCPKTYTFLDGTSTDGCAGAPSGTAQLPTILNSYGANRPPWNVAAVDYYVGPASGTVFADPTTSPPAGCSYNGGGSFLDCRGTNNLTIQNFDFTLHGGVSLLMDGHGQLVKNNMFQNNCTTGRHPLQFLSPDAGTNTVTQNLFNGRGTACGSTDGDMIQTQTPAASSITVITYNEFRDVPEDAIRPSGSTSGNATATIQYNLFNSEGYVGHPDGVQWPKDHFIIQSNLNTFYNVFGKNADGSAGTKIQVQPFHGQPDTAGVATNPTTNYNTVISTNGGSQCTSGNYGVIPPSPCSANQLITCEQDTGTTVTSYKAYGNYLDASGAISGLLNYPNNSTPSCSGVNFGGGGVENNINMVSGSTCAIAGAPC